MRLLAVCWILVSMGCTAKDPNADADSDADTDSDGACNGEIGNELGDRFDDFGFPDCAGETVTQEAVAGDVMLFNISTGWCAPCREETPYFQEFYEAHEAEGLSIVQVLAQDNDSQNATSAFCDGWATQYALTYSVLFMPIDAMLDVYFTDPGTQMPLNIVVDREGCVTYRAVGSTSGFDAISGALLAALD